MHCTCTRLTSATTVGLSVIIITIALDYYSVVYNMQ